MTTLTDQAVEVAIDTACRTLRLPTIRERAAQAAATAAREQHTYQGFLAELLLAECDDRDERRLARRVHDAGFPRPKRLDEIDYAANPNLNPAVINTLAGGEWVGKGRPLCLIGDSGTGKTHLPIGLGTAAAEAGYRVRYVLASRLVNELPHARCPEMERSSDHGSQGGADRQEVAVGRRGVVATRPADLIGESIANVRLHAGR